MTSDADHARLSFALPVPRDPGPLLNADGRVANPYRPPDYIPVESVEQSERFAAKLIEQKAWRPDLVLFSGPDNIAFYLKQNRVVARVALGARVLLVSCNCYRLDADTLHLYRTGVQNAETGALVATGRISISFFAGAESTIAVDDWASPDDPRQNAHAALECEISGQRMGELSRAVEDPITGLIHRLPFQMYCPGDPLVLWFNEGGIALRLTYTAYADPRGTTVVQCEATLGNWGGRYPGEEEIKWSNEQILLKSAPLPSGHLITPAWKIRLGSEPKANAPVYALVFDLYRAPSLTITAHINGAGADPVVFDLLSPLPYRYAADAPPVLLERYRLIENWIYANAREPPTKLPHVY